MFDSGSNSLIISDGLVAKLFGSGTNTASFKIGPTVLVDFSNYLIDASQIFQNKIIFVLLLKHDSFIALICYYYIQQIVNTVIIFYKLKTVLAIFNQLTSADLNIFFNFIL